MSTHIYYVYKTTNLINGNIYIGKHQTKNINDGYLGSGNLIIKAIKKYGRENFVKEILHYCESEEEMNKLESEIVTEDFVKQSGVYNIASGGQGGSGVAKCVTKEGRKLAGEKISRVLKGRTAETHEHVAQMAEKKRGRNLSNDESVRRATEKRRGRNSLNNESVARGAKKRRGRTKETHESLKRQGEKQSQNMTGSGNPASRAWIIMDPEGVIYHIDNLPLFCKERNLPYSSIQGRWKYEANIPVPSGRAIGWCVISAELNRDLKREE